MPKELRRFDSASLAERGFFRGSSPLPMRAGRFPVAARQESEMKTVTEVRARLADKMNQQAGLVRQLDHSLAVQAFEPRAFDGPGKCSQLRNL